MCIDANQKVVFFTPKGKALFGAPPSPQPRPQKRSLSPQLRKLRPAGEKSRPVGERSARAGPGSEGRLEPQQRKRSASAYPGASRWARDSDIPWAVEARVWEALDSG